MRATGKQGRSVKTAAQLGLMDQSKLWPVPIGGNVARRNEDPPKRGALPTVNPVSYHRGGGMDCRDGESASGATIGHMEGQGWLLK